MLCMLGMLQPLLAGVTGSFRQLSLQLLSLHKATAKLGYIVTSLLSGVMQEGFCTANESEEGAAGAHCLRLITCALCCENAGHALHRRCQSLTLCSLCGVQADVWHALNVCAQQLSQKR